MKGFVIALMVLVSGTAFAADKKPIDLDCQKMATNARGFAELKQGGIATTPDQLAKFVVTPTVATYPIRSVLQFVLNAPDPSPEQVYTSLYNKCTLMGYKELFAYFTEREEADGLRIQVAEQNQMINQLRTQVAGLTQQVTDLRYPPAPVRRAAQQPRVVEPPAPPAKDPFRTTELPIGCTKADGTPCGTHH
jgi:hypothetical protein